MMYWIILIALAVLILVTIIATIVTIIKERKDFKSYELDEEDDIDDEPEEDEIEERPAKRRRKQDQAEAPAHAKKLRWKIILKNADTGEQYDFIFYDAVGIGRTTKDVAFEAFLPLPDDRKISKVHCSIVRSRDKLYLRDEGSKNHTYLNGRKIQKPILIQKADIISIGETDLEVLRIMREAN